jgi:hypothetical protein
MEQFLSWGAIPCGGRTGTRRGVNLGKCEQKEERIKIKGKRSKSKWGRQKGRIRNKYRHTQESKKSFSDGESIAFRPESRAVAV